MPKELKASNDVSVSMIILQGWSSGWLSKRGAQPKAFQWSELEICEVIQTSQWHLFQQNEAILDMDKCAAVNVIR